MACVMWIHLGAQEKLFSWRWQKHKRPSRNLGVLKMGPQNSHATSIHILLATACLLTKPKVEGWGSTLCPRAKGKKCEVTWQRAMVHGGVTLGTKFDQLWSFGRPGWDLGFISNFVQFFSLCFFFYPNASCTIKDSLTVHVTLSLQGGCYVSIL